MSTRIICESGVASLFSSRQRLILQHKHALQGGYHMRCQKSPRMEYSLELLKKYSVRRFSSSGGMKSPKRSVISGTKDSTSREPVMPFSQFLKSYLQPKPMPDRWSSAWYREMALICTVFAITGSSTMVLVSSKVKMTENMRRNYTHDIQIFFLHTLINPFANAYGFNVQYEWYRYVLQFQRD